MSKWRKKPVVIEAVQLLWSTWDEMSAFANVGKLEDGRPTGCYIGSDGRPLPDYAISDEMGLLIPTLEGLIIARQNDWIIRGIKGELYCCRDDIFRMTYEPVDDAVTAPAPTSTPPA